MVLLLGGGVGCARGGGEDGRLPLLLLFPNSCELVIIVIVILHVHGLIAQPLWDGGGEEGGRRVPGLHTWRRSHVWGDIARYREPREKGVRCPHECSAVHA